MNAHTEFSLSRRRLLQTGGAFVVAFSLVKPGQLWARSLAAAKSLDPTELDSWLAIAPDGTVTIYFGKVDVGQGVDVAMAQIVADELDAPFSAMRVEMGDSFREINQGDASGSTAVALAGAALRVAAAEARRVLVANAAQQWGVDPASLNVADGVISGGGKRITYGQLIGGKAFNATLGWNKKDGNALALTAQAKPKAPDRYKVVGKSFPRYDIPGKAYGTYPFVPDVRRPGMLHGRMIRPKVAGAVPVSYDESSIAGIANARVVRKEDLIGVVAEKEWDAIQASQKLKVTWSQVQPPYPKQAKLYDHIRQAPATKHDDVTKDGDFDSAFAGAAKTVEAQYEWPYQSHASMGPGCAVADVTADGATVWTGSQKPHYTAEGVAKLLGLPEEKVRSVWVYGPGSYGRNDAGDAAMDAAVLSQAVGKPVRVQYMRYEGSGWDPKGPPSVHTVRAGLDASGKIVALYFNSKGMSRLETLQTEASPGDTLAGQLLGFKSEGKQIFGGPDNGYEIPNLNVSWDTVAGFLEKASPLRTAHVRDPLGPQIQFAVESFMDELAHAANADPVAFRLEHLTDARDIAVIKAAAEKAGWKTGSAGTRRSKSGDVSTGMGIAYARRNATRVAVVAEVEVNARTGRVWGKRFVVAQDVGLVVNPNGLKLCIEGNVVQGLSRALLEEVMFTPQNVTSVDWVTYPILEMADAPESIDVVLLDHPELPASGAGESAIRLVAAAVNNAVFEATGTRIRRAPLTPARVRAGLA